MLIRFENNNQIKSVTAVFSLFFRDRVCCNKHFACVFDLFSGLEENLKRSMLIAGGKKCLYLEARPKVNFSTTSANADGLETFSLFSLRIKMCRSVMSKAVSLCVCFSVMVAAVLWVISLHLCTTVLGKSSARNALIKSSSSDDSSYSNLLHYNLSP